MVIRAATYGTADHDHGGEDVYGYHSSSTYFKQFLQSIKANTPVTAVLYIQDTTRSTGQIALSDRIEADYTHQGGTGVTVDDRSSCFG
jgi:hypothetical protein